MYETTESSRFQFRLSYLVSLPLLISPFFVGASSFRLNPALLQPRLFGHIAGILFLYVLFCCWLAIRHSNLSSDYRRFPFRGSGLVGSLAGIAFIVQLLLGAGIGTIAADPAEAIVRLTVGTIVGYLIGTALYGFTVGSFAGGFFGLVAGGLYCGLRYVGVSHSRATPISKKAWRRRGQNREQPEISRPPIVR